MAERYHMSKGIIVEVGSGGKFNYNGVPYVLIGGINRDMFAFSTLEDEPYDRVVTMQVLVPKGENPERKYWQFKDAVHQRVRIGDSLVANEVSKHHGGTIDTKILGDKVVKIEELPIGVETLAGQS